MEVKQSVKQRRLERLKRLHEHDERHRLPPSSEGNGMPAVRQESGASLISHRQPEAGPWDDPEYVWKMKLHQDGIAGGGARYARPLDEPARKFSPPTARQLWVRLILSAVLFAMVWTMFRLPYPWAEAGRQFVASSLTEPMNTEGLAAWYETTFRGTPSILPSFHRSGDESIKASSGGNRTFFAPAKGALAQPYSSAKQGIVLATKQDAPVYAMDTGIVTFAGIQEGSGFTVVLRHPNGVETTYGHVAECKLEVNDWIKGGEAIGKATTEGGGGMIYFAVQKDGRFVNPADVVSIVP